MLVGRVRAVKDWYTCQAGSASDFLPNFFLRSLGTLASTVLRAGWRAECRGWIDMVRCRSGEDEPHEHVIMFLSRQEKDSTRRFWCTSTSRSFVSGWIIICIFLAGWPTFFHHRVTCGCVEIRYLPKVDTVGASSPGYQQRQAHNEPTSTISPGI
jgi:hypothetical protein